MNTTWSSGVSYLDQQYRKTMWIAFDSAHGIIVPGEGVAAREEQPSKFSLAQNTPNPFNASTTIAFTLDHRGPVNLDIYSVSGQRVARMVDGVMDSGPHTVVWDATGFSSGVYLCVLRADGTSRTITMTLTK
jgi:hypothetical protein